MLLIAELLPHHEKAVTVKGKFPNNENDIDEEILEKEFGIIIFIILLIRVAGIIYVLVSPPDQFKITF